MCDIINSSCVSESVFYSIDTHYVQKTFVNDIANPGLNSILEHRYLKNTS